VSAPVNQREPTTLELTRINLRPLANPLPLGFLALGGATFLLSGLQLGWVEPQESHQVGLIIIAFVVPLQFLASVLGFLARDVGAGTGMGILSGTWLSVGLITLTGTPGSTSDALGLLLLLSAAAMLVPALAASGKLVAAAVLTTAALRFAVTGIYQLTGNQAWKTTAGMVGLALCALGVYTALAMALEDSRKRTVLPLLRRNVGANALHDEVAHQVSEIEHEAGIRAQL
jgi:succinate-acetate transporter protein